MCRLPPETLAQAIRTVDQMDLRQKELLADEIYEQQPNLLASVLVHSRMGSPMDQIDRVLHVLLVAYEAVKIAGLQLMLITEDDQERNLGRWVGHVKFLEGLDDRSRSTAVQHIGDHPEKYLLAYAYDQLLDAGIHHMDQENDKNLVLLVFNIATCIGEAAQEPGQQV
jgi:hypothetical protein